MPGLDAQHHRIGLNPPTWLRRGASELRTGMPGLVPLPSISAPAGVAPNLSCLGIVEVSPGGPTTFLVLGWAAPVAERTRPPRRQPCWLFADN